MNRVWNWQVQTVLYSIEWISNAVLLYSTGNYVQNPGIIHNGKEYKKDCRHMYNFAVQQK